MRIATDIQTVKNPASASLAYCGVSYYIDCTAKEKNNQPIGGGNELRPSHRNGKVLATLFLDGHVDHVDMAEVRSGFNTSRSKPLNRPFWGMKQN